jgi:opacity protein-like surface antigen
MKLNYLSRTTIFLLAMLTIIKSHAETTDIDLNINKSDNVRYPTARGKMSVGCDKLCISYKSRRHGPTCLNSLLGNNINLLNLFSKTNNNQCEYFNDIYYFEAGLGRTINYVDADERKLKRAPTMRFSDTFQPKSIGKAVLLTISGGYVWKFDSPLVPYASLGLEYSYLPNVRVHGDIYAKAEEPAYLYQYSVNHSNLHLLGKINLYQWKSFMPYAMLGLGGSCNVVQNYKEYNLNNSRTVPVSVKGLKSYGFSYSAGLGLDFQCRKDFVIGLGYRYDNFGSINSGNFTGLYKGNHLSNSFSASNIVLTGRYLFQ